MKSFAKHLIEVLSRFDATATSRDVGVFESSEIFSCQGKFKASNTEVHLRELERQLDSKRFPRAIKKRVYSLAVEMIQNIVHHGLSCSNEEDASFAVLNRAETIHLISQNCVFASDISKISQSIDFLNAMTDAELRKYHVELLCDNDFSSKGGAGLGLVTLARKADGRIDYQFEERASGEKMLTLHLKFSLIEDLSK